MADVAPSALGTPRASRQSGLPGARAGHREARKPLDFARGIRCASMARHEQARQGASSGCPVPPTHDSIMNQMKARAREWGVCPPIGGLRRARFSSRIDEHGSKKRSILDDGSGHFVLGSLFLVDVANFRETESPDGPVA